VIKVIKVINTSATLYSGQLRDELYWKKKILWLAVLLVKETGVPGENHWPSANHWQTLSH